MKLEVDEVVSIVRETMAAQKINEPVIEKTIKEVLKLSQDIKNEEKADRAPKTRKEYCVAATGTDDPNILKAYVFQLESGVEPHTLLQKISAAATDYNGSSKGKKRPAKSISAAVETIANKFFKTQGLNRKTKEPVWVFKHEDKLV